MLNEKWEGVFEEIIGTFFEWDSLKGIPKALVSFLELLGESFIGIVCSRCHINGYSKRRAG